MSKIENFICVDCDRSYTRKENFLQHFDNEKVRIDGVLVKNKCFGSKIRKYATSKKEKELFKKQKNIFSFCEQKDIEPSNTDEISDASLNKSPSHFSNASLGEGTSAPQIDITDAVENTTELITELDELFRTPQAASKKALLEASSLPDENVYDILKENSEQSLKNQVLMIKLLKEITLQQKPIIKKEKAETKETTSGDETQAFLNSIKNANSMKYILSNR